MVFTRCFPRVMDGRETLEARRSAQQRQEVRRNACHLLCPSTPTPTLIPIEEQRLIKPATHSRYKPNTGFGCALFDATNGFNMLDRYLMLWTVRHRWTSASRFVFNVHCHDIICIGRTLPGQEAKALLWREGITQGGVMGLTIYGILTMPLVD